MEGTYEKLTECYESIRRRTDFLPEVAVVLGSGLGGFADCVEDGVEVPYGEIMGFPISTVPGHAGRFVFGTVAGVRVAVMQGRVHYYEGYPVADVVLPARLLGRMGAKALLLTNAAGGVGEQLCAGDLMLITDHIMTFFPNPLLGPNLDQLGPRFPDMTAVYDPALSDCLRVAALDLAVTLKEGVYAQLTGPSFETPAEVRMLKAMGAHAVGMSTACEAVAAHHCGLRVAGVSCIANMAAGISPNPLTHVEVQAAAAQAAPRFQALLTAAVENFHRELSR